MQLGSRWQVGQPPHPGVPAELHAAIADAEASHPAGLSWTLTWLEGRPRVELLGQHGKVFADLGIDASGDVVSAARGEAHHAPGAEHTDDDDDDWLN